jgi:hypothetical protein
LSTERKQNLSSRILYPAKLLSKIDGGIKVICDKQKLKWYITTKPPQQKILQGILHIENKNKHNNKMNGSIKPYAKNKQVYRW